MKTSQLTIYLSLLICFFLNTAMISSNANTAISSSIEQQKSEAKPTKSKKRYFKKFKKAQKRILKRLRKVTGVEDGPTMLLAIGALILGGILIYYLFQLGFFVGLLAIVAVSIILYLLFRYLNY
jgi:Flp pilus assembly protein TadB